MPLHTTLESLRFRQQKHKGGREFGVLPCCFPKLAYQLLPDTRVTVKFGLPLSP